MKKLFVVMLIAVMGVSFLTYSFADCGVCGSGEGAISEETSDAAVAKCEACEAMAAEGMEGKCAACTAKAEAAAVDVDVDAVNQ
ncbi:MAG: hypothetical protein ABIG64_01350 [Candidatus Omnitrophota bacterium]